MTDLSPHQERIAEDLIGVIDYARRVLIAAQPGSMYQLDKAHGLRDAADRLIKRLDKQTLDLRQGDAVAAAVWREAGRYTLGQVLMDNGLLGGSMWTGREDR